VEVYNRSSEQAHTLTLATSVLDGQDGRPVFQTKDSREAQAGSKLRTDGFTATIPLKDFRPGTYVLRVEASSSGDKAVAFRELLFEVGR
jgi:hypothetical protein